MNNLQRSLVALAAWLMASVLLAAEPLAPGDHTRTLTVDDRERTYLVHVPKSYDDAKPTPVVLAFHGGGSHAEQFVQFSGLNEKANEAGFIAVYPNGTGRFPRMLTWNGGNCCGYAMQNKVDDVAFVRALLDDLAKVATIDEKRIYGTGRDGAEVILLVIEGGGHTWPGRETRAKWLGGVTKDISANDLMWEFFEKHPMK